MALDTYAGLQEELAEALMRGDLDARIPSWITMCEASVRRLLKSQSAIVRAYINAGGANERYENLPGDFYELVSTPRVNTDDGRSLPIEYVTPQTMDNLWRNPAVDVPRFFTIVGGQIQFYPQPNGHQVEIAYRQGVPALADANTSNALLLEAPDIYLYGSLIHSAPYLSEDERLAVWSELYISAVGDFNIAHLR